MADSKNDSKKTHTTEDTAGGERLHRPQSFKKLPSPSESNTGQQGSEQQGSNSSSSKSDSTSNGSSESKSDATSGDSSKGANEK